MTGIKDNIEITSMLSFDEKETCKLGIITHEHGGRLVEYANITRTSRLGSKTNLYKSFKIDPQTCLNVFKFPRKAEKMQVNVILGNKIRGVAKLEETKTLPLESYLKKNLSFASDEQIVDSFIEYVPLVDSTIETVVVKKVEQVEVKNNVVEYEQLSLFSYIDDED